MKDLRFPALLLVIMVSLTSCEIIGDIFKAGIWVGIILVAIIVMVIMWVLRKMRR